MGPPSSSAFPVCSPPLPSSTSPPSCLVLPFLPEAAYQPFPLFTPSLPGARHPVLSGAPAGHGVLGGKWADLSKAARRAGPLPLGTGVGRSFVRWVLNSPLHAGTEREPPSWPGGWRGSPRLQPSFLKAQVPPGHGWPCLAYLASERTGEGRGPELDPTHVSLAQAGGKQGSGPAPGLPQAPRCPRLIPTSWRDGAHRCL